jgi:hypothetical protein
MSTTLRERPRTHRYVQRDDLLSRYLRALDRYAASEAQSGATTRLGDVRTCACCGETASFQFDPRDGWAFCTACGRAP